MASTPSSIEVQIDNFLEHFKRSATKAMDQAIGVDTVDCAGPSLVTAVTASSIFGQSSPLTKTRTRSSCFDISQLSLSSSAGKMNSMIIENQYINRIIRWPWYKLFIWFCLLIFVFYFTIDVVCNFLLFGENCKYSKKTVNIMSHCVTCNLHTRQSPLWTQFYLFRHNTWFFVFSFGCSSCFYYYHSLLYFWTILQNHNLEKQTRKAYILSFFLYII